MLRATLNAKIYNGEERVNLEFGFASDEYPMIYYRERVRGILAEAWADINPLMASKTIREKYTTEEGYKEHIDVWTFVFLDKNENDLHNPKTDVLYIVNQEIALSQTYKDVIENNIWNPDRTKFFLPLNKLEDLRIKGNTEDGEYIKVEDKCSAY